MTLEEAIKHEEEVVKEQKELYGLCPLSESEIFHCDGTKDCKTLKNGKNKGCQKCAEEHRQLAKWLKELKQLREQTQWIPVSEGLPKKSGNYWCTFGGTNIAGIDYYTTESDAKEIFYDPEDYEYAGWRSQNVIAWMPLPESYKPQESKVIKQESTIIKDGYPVVTLCGSTRFKKEFMETQKRLTLEGNIVISVGLFGHSGDEEVWDGMDEGTLSKTKKMLDDMHKRKIDMADEIFVINVGGYIGDSTRSEIEYAKMHDKKVRYLEG